MSVNLNIPAEIEKNAIDIFGRNYSDRGKELVEQSMISISFQKGTVKSFFIISGIILEQTNRESRLTFKKVEDNILLKTSCTCSRWTEDKYCEHIAGLYLKFCFNNYLSEEHESSDSKASPQLLSQQGKGVHVESYGTVINGPNRLVGSNHNSTYSSNQYLLTNNRIIDFPMVESFTDKILIYLKRAKDVLDTKQELEAEMEYVAKFYIEKDGERIEEISLFEYFYFFNWITGQIYHQPNEFKNFIRALKANQFTLTINDYLRLTHSVRTSGLVDIFVNDKNINEIDKTHLKYHVKASPSHRKNFLDLSIEVFDDKNIQLSIPEPFQLFVFDNGLLSSFKTKTDAKGFINNLLTSVGDENLSLVKKNLYSTDKKAYITEWLEYILYNKEITLFDPFTDELFQFNTSQFLTLVLGIFKHFGDHSFKYSQIFPRERSILYQIPEKLFFEGISEFYKETAEKNINVYYNSSKVQAWTSNIKFDRNLADLDWFDLTLSMDSSDFELIDNAKLNDEFLVSDKGLILLNEDQKNLLRFMKKFTKSDQVASEDKDGKKTFKLYLNKARIFELFELRKMGINGALSEEDLALCQRLENLEEMPKYPIPEEYINIARHYQTDGYNWLRFLHENKFGACLADDMGLGKTLQTIMFLNSIKDTIKQCLVICPVSILMNWKNEIEKFSSLDIGIYYGDDRKFPEDKKVLITSYGIMKKEAETVFKDKIFDVIVFDEVQHLKNVKSLGAIAARKIRAKFKICLTGTPVENDLSEFYNIIDLAVPGVWGDNSLFKSANSEKMRLLAKNTAKPFIMRRTKSQVLTELPDKIDNHVYLNFSSKEKERYKNKLALIQERMVDTSIKSKYGEILKSLLELRQLCLWQQSSEIASTKVDFLMENLEQIIEEGHKVLIFSQFTTYLDIIQKRITQKSWKFSRIDGSKTMKTRQKEVEAFQDGENQVFLISLKAGGVGLNLTAANYIFLMDPWWNPAVENQAIDRAHRIGQKNKVTVYRPIIKDSIEEKVLVLQQAKKELFDELLSSKDTDFYNGRLSMDDFKNLLT